MINKSIFSNSEQLELLANTLGGYLLQPFGNQSVPGNLMEHILGFVRKGQVLDNYDFVDVIQTISESEAIGWQVKSTKSTTPVTWKRAKIGNSATLINNSLSNDDYHTKILGDALIDFCNEHIKHSIDKYGLQDVGYSRLIVNSDNTLTYFEKKLCDRNNPILFYKDEFDWKWSKQKVSLVKEQLPALHGTHLPTGLKWFAWHGLGENQLHFTGEKYWWPSREDEKLTINFPSNRLSLERYLQALANLASDD